MRKCENYLKLLEGCVYMWYGFVRMLNDIGQKDEKYFMTDEFLKGVYSKSMLDLIESKEGSTLIINARTEMGFPLNKNGEEKFKIQVIHDMKKVIYDALK